MSFAVEHMRNNIWRGRFTSFPEDICVHGFSCRLGGVSKAPYTSLNMALHVEDDPAAVWQNRQLFLQALNLKADLLVTPEQVHGEAIVRVTADEAGKGSREYNDAIAETDALITNEPGLPLMLCFADCTPIILLDPANKAVGIAHGGWRGTVARIAQKTVLRMQQEFGTDPQKVLAGIGPAIGPCCYEVGDEVAAKFASEFKDHETKLLTKCGDSIHLDLWQANKIQLQEAGLLASNIELANVCTACKHSWFYSYRADGGKTGRMAAVIALNKY